MKYNVATAIISITFPLYPMNYEKYLPAQALIIHRHNVEDVIGTASEFIKNFNNFKNKENAQSLVTIIEQVGSLKRANITEEDLGFHTLITKKNDSFFANFLQSEFTPEKAPIHLNLSILFKQIGLYNNHLSKNNLESPNKTEIDNYFTNEMIYKASRECVSCGIYISENILKSATLPLRKNAAFDNLKALLSNISCMLKKNPAKILTMTNLIYHKKLIDLQPSNNNKDMTIAT
jgi:hypothetical protein